jgi:hypothetical protein
LEIVWNLKKVNIVFVYYAGWYASEEVTNWENGLVVCKSFLTSKTEINICLNQVKASSHEKICSNSERILNIYTSLQIPFSFILFMWYI